MFVSFRLNIQLPRFNIQKAAYRFALLFCWSASAGLNPVKPLLAHIFQASCLQYSRKPKRGMAFLLPQERQF